VWSSADDFVSAQGEPDVFVTEMDVAERDGLLAGWARAVDATVAWARAGATP
jgi:hypothetical protein